VEKYSGQESLLHELLTSVDPKMGEYLHSKDRRRVINALFKYFKYLYQASDAKIVRESDIQMLHSGLKLRYYPVLIWIRATQSILE
jgi:tRNA A37 N6-isopentenylltransferase MiaA